MIQSVPCSIPDGSTCGIEKSTNVFFVWFLYVHGNMPYVLHKAVQLLFWRERLCTHASSSQGIRLSLGILALVVKAPAGITFWASFPGLTLHDNNLLFSCHFPFKY